MPDDKRPAPRGEQGSAICGRLHARLAASARPASTNRRESDSLWPRQRDDRNDRGATAGSSSKEKPLAGHPACHKRRHLSPKPSIASMYPSGAPTCEGRLLRTVAAWRFHDASKRGDDRTQTRRIQRGAKHGAHEIARWHQTTARRSRASRPAERANDLPTRLIVIGVHRGEPAATLLAPSSGVVGVNVDPARRSYVRVAESSGDFLNIPTCGDQR